MPDDLTESTSGVLFEDNTPASTPKPTDNALENANPGRIDLTSGSAASLDELMKTATTDDGDETPAEVTPKPETPAKTEVPAKTETPAAKVAPKTIVPEPKAETPPKTETPAVPAKDKFDEIQLPPHAKPATVTSFEKLKTISRAEVAEKQKIIDAKEKELEEVKKKIPEAGKLLPEVENELKELRAFRTAHDISADPAFQKEYVASVTRNNESIIKKLTGAGFSEAHMAKIKEIGLDKLDWKPVLDALDPTAKRSIEALLLSNEQINDRRTAALDEAKKNPEKYTAERTKIETDRKTAEDKAVRDTIEQGIGNVEWMKETPIPPGATTEEKATLEARNKFSVEQNARMKTMLEDTSPAMRGQMIASTLLAYQFQGQFLHFKKLYEADHTELEKVRKASTTRKAERAAPAPRDTPPPPISILKHGSDALDELAAAARNDE